MRVQFWCAAAVARAAALRLDGRRRLGRGPVVKESNGQ